MRTLNYPSSARRRAHFTSFRDDGCRARGGCVDQGREQQGYSKPPRSAESYCSSILVDEIGFFVCVGGTLQSWVHDGTEMIFVRLGSTLL